MRRALAANTPPVSHGGSARNSTIATMLASRFSPRRSSPSPRVPGYRSTVSYLQVQRPATMLFGDEIVLRKDEFGTYHVVQSGDGGVGSEGELLADGEEKEVEMGLLDGEKEGMI